MKTRIKAIICSALSLLLGGIGIQKFYLGQTKRGLLYVLFFWTGIPYLLCIVDLLKFIFMSDKSFNLKYNKEYVNKELYEDKIEEVYAHRFDNTVEAEYTYVDENSKKDDVNNYSSNKEDDVISMALKYHKEIENTIISIKDYEFSSYVRQLNGLFKDIIDMANNSNKKSSIIKDLDKMLDYNIPTTLKLINSYIDLSSNTVDSLNVSNVKLGIKDSILSVIKFLQSVLTKIQEDNLMDINSDIDVLKTTLKNGGYV
ncbi:TM2 domain-containing protein [uncultured Brachyspira sp.]|uniref:TM2 domain-containing protein n=1 Tax=uncultured Brachyspira sp. TaxID=221953 RepID=UPI00260D659C|nr:TM2 domain-containing protein [uncultured Brachyspira sp.]